MAALQLEVLDCGVQIDCVDEDARALLQNAYRSFKRPFSQTQINYQVTRGLAGSLFIARHGACPQISRGLGDFICKFDKDLIIETQKLRPDLYFVHAAVVAFRDRAIALVAPSGFGKSTTTWALLHHNFQYLSDEIAPIEPRTFRVLPFPRALCLKNNPPRDYSLPLDVIATGRTVHVPTGVLPNGTITEPLSLDSILFLRFLGEDEVPRLKRLGAAESTVRLCTNALNPLAHRDCGLDSAMAIVANARCYELLTGNLRSTCELIKATCVQKLNDHGIRFDSSPL
jgi:hypothetical protein